MVSVREEARMLVSAVAREARRCPPPTAGPCWFLPTPSPPSPSQVDWGLREWVVGPRFSSWSSSTYIYFLRFIRWFVLCTSCVLFCDITGICSTVFRALRILVCSVTSLSTYRFITFYYLFFMHDLHMLAFIWLVQALSLSTYLNN